MSKNIDENVVSMSFDNSKFEKNVEQSIKTTDKLKESLKFDGVEKGLDKITKNAKAVDISSIGTQVDNIANKFTLMGMIGMNAMQDIARKAVSTGETLLKSMSTDQLAAGWKKYEDKTQNVQTLVNSTGKSVEEINGYLDRLQWFSDETSYAFTDMTSALATMTSSGGDIEKLIPVITGIANATAYAGKGAKEFTRVIYNLNQAYSSGKLQLMDWKSVENAGASSKQLKEMLIQAGEAIGTIKQGEVTVNSFNNSLAKGWATRDVMEIAFGKFSAVSEEVSKIVSITDDAYTAAEAIDLLSGKFAGNREEAQKLVNYGVYQNVDDALESLGGKYDELALRAFKSAQEAKTFNEAIEATKDAVSSGWAKSFEIIFGDYDKAKDLWTGVANWLYDVFAAGETIRNKILEASFSSPIVDIGKKLGLLEAPAENAVDAVQTVTGALEDLDGIAKRVIRGDFGSGAKRVDELTKAGYNYYAIQNKVNELLGDTFRFSDELAAANEKVVETNSEIVESQKEFKKITLEQIEGLAALDASELKNQGYTAKQIKIVKELKKEADNLGVSIEDLVNAGGQINGRWYITDSLSILGDTILNVLGAIKDAFHEVFYGTTDEAEIAAKAAGGIQTVLSKIHSVISLLKTDENTVNKLTSAFKGLFSLLDLAGYIVGGPIKIVFEIFKAVLDEFDITILDVVASIGDWITRGVEWFKNTFKIKEVISFLAPIIKNIVEQIADWVRIVQEWIDEHVDVQEIFGTISSTIETAIGYIKDWVSGLMAAKNKPKYIAESMVNAFVWLKDQIGNIISDIINLVLGGGESAGSFFSQGFIGGVKDFLTPIWNAVVEFGRQALDGLKNVLGIHSPAKETFVLGAFTGEGFVNGLLSVLKLVGDAVIHLGTIVLNAFKNLNLGQIVAGAIIASFAVGVQKLGRLTDGISSVLEGVGSFTKNIGGLVGAVKDGFTALTKGLKSALKLRAVASMLKSFAILLAVIVGSIIGLTLFMEHHDISGALWVVGGALAAMIAAVVVMGIFLKGLDKDAVLGVAGILLSFAACVLALGIAFGIMGKIDPESMTQARLSILALGVMAALLIAISSKTDIQDIEKAKGIIKSISLALLMVAIASWIFKSITWNDLGKAGAAIGGLAIVVWSLIDVSDIPGGQEKLKGAAAIISAVGTAFLLLALASVIFSKISWEGLAKAGLALIVVKALIKGLIKATQKAGKGDIAAAAGIIGACGGAILALSVAALILSTLPNEALGKVILMIAVISAMVVGLIASTRLATEKQIKGVALTLVSMGVCVGILALVAALLGYVPTENLWKGVAAVSILGIIVGYMTKQASDVKSAIAPLIVMTIMIGILGGILIALTAIDPKGSLTAAAGIALVLFALSECFKTISKAGINAKGLAAVAVLIVMVAAIGGVLFFLKESDPMSVIGSAIGIAIVLAAMVLAFKMLDTDKSVINSALSAVLLMSVVLVGITFALGILANADPLNVIGAAVGVGIVLLALSASTLILSKIQKKVDIKLVGTVALLTLIVGAIAFSLSLLKNMSPEKSIGAAVGISMVLAVITGAIFILSKLGRIDPSILVGVVLMGLVVVGIAFAFSLLQGMNPDSILPIAVGLALVLSTLVVLLIPLTLIGYLAVEAIAGIIVLDLFIANLAAVLWGLGKLADDIGPWIEKGFPILMRIGEAIGGFVGSIINGFLTAATANLGEIGSNLTEFADSARPFFEFLSEIDQNALDGAARLAGIVAVIGGGELAAAWSQVLTLGFGDEAMIESFKTLGKGISAFADSISGLTEDDLVATGVAAQIGAQLSSLSGFNAFTDVGKIKEFFESLPTIGQKLKVFSDNADGIKESTVAAAGRCADIIIAFSKDIPNSGGLLGDIIGNNDLGEFAAQLPLAGLNLKAFGDNVDGIKEEAVKAAGTCMGIITEFCDEIPNDGGALGWIVGNNDFGTFASKLPQAGTDLKAFGDNVDGINTNAAKEAKIVMGIITAFANNIPNSGQSFVSFFVGDNDIEEFSRKLPVVGANMVLFAAKVALLSASQFAKAKGMATAFTEILKAMAQVGSFKVLSIFGWINQIPAAGQAMADFAEKTSDSKLSRVGYVIKSMQALAVFANTLNSSSIDNLQKFSESLNNVAYVMTESFVNQLNSDATKKAARNCIDIFIKLMTQVIVAGESKIEEATKTLCYGIVIGLANMRPKVETAARQMGSAVSDSVKKGMNEQSPSKDGIEAGEFMGEGIIIGLKNMHKAVSNSGTELGTTASDSVTKAINDIASAIELAPDAQPTIRPVLDLTDFNNGISAMASRISPTTSVKMSGSVATSSLRSPTSVIKEDNAGLVRELKELRSDVSSLASKFEGLEVTLDGNAVVGKLAPKINYKLGKMTQNARRGV